MKNNEQEPKQRLGVTIGANLFYAGLLIGIGATFGRGAADRIIDKLAPPPPPQPQNNPNQLKPSEAVLSSPATKELQLKLLGDYLNIKRRYETFMQEPLTIDETRLGALAVAGEFDQLARQHLVNGIYLAKITLPPEKEITISPDLNHPQVAFHGRIFDIDKPLHFHLLAGIVELELTSQLREAEREGKIKKVLEEYGGSQERNEMIVKNEEEFYRLQQEQDRAQVNDLLWLYDKNPAIEIDPNAFAFLPAIRLSYHSRVLQALERARLPFPKNVSYIRHTKEMGIMGGGYYDHETSRPFTIVITNASGESAVIHEVGHFISDATYLDPENPKLAQISQKEFERQVKAVLEKEAANIKDSKKSFATNPPPPNDIEDYAATFEEFFWRGSNFRAKLRGLRDSDPAAQRVLQTKYQSMRMVFEGEFVREGQPLIKKYAVGAYALVQDEDTDFPGILLRQEPDGDLDPSLPAVFDGDRVKIIEGPTLIRGRRPAEERVSWKVQVIGRSSKSQRSVGFAEGEGWILENWLGETVQN